MKFSTLFETLRGHHDISADDAAAAMGAIMDGGVPPAQIGGLLMALALKGERPHEIVGFARAMRERAVKPPHVVSDVFDTCGTGGDGTCTFNISTATALVVAGAGLRVAKHGNRAVSSNCGSADVFEALGVHLEADPQTIVQALEEAGIAFFFAPAWHPSMRHAAPVRRELGVRTAFNLLGPLTNPGGATRQLIGVSRPEHTELLARALGLLGTTSAWVVHGAGGLDELSTLGHTKVTELNDGTVRTFYVHPADAGLPTTTMDALRGGTAAENASIIEALLDGETGARRDIVLFNAGAALLIAGTAGTLTEGVQLAADSIDAGRAKRALDAMRRICSRN